MDELKIAAFPERMRRGLYQQVEDGRNVNYAR
jgi:hypothetical protein